MNEDDDWYWWQTVAAVGGVAVAAGIVGKCYMDYQEKQVAQHELIKKARETLKDSTVIITGANAGNGYEAAKLFAEGGAKVIMACRNATKCAIAAASIRNKTKNPQVSCEPLDLTDLHSIETFASKVTKCHVLVNNAGEILAGKYLKYGVEKTFLSNYLGPWYLTQLLLPRLALTSLTEQREVRVVTVGSRAEKYTTLGSDYVERGSAALRGLFQGVEPHQPFLSYSTSKLCTLLSHYHLSRKLADSPWSLISMKPNSEEQGKQLQLSAVAVTPGFTNTNIFKFTSPWVNLLSSPIRYVTLKSAADGGREILHASLAPQAHGAYFGESRRIEPSATAKDEKLGQALWEHTERVLEEMKREEKEKTLPPK